MFLTGCWHANFTDTPYCSACLAALAPDPPDGALAVWTTPNAHVALYPHGVTRHYDGVRWTDPIELWPPAAGRIMLEQAYRRDPERVTPAGFAALGVDHQEHLFA